MRRFLLVCAAVAALGSIPLAAQQGRQGAPGPGGRGQAGPPPSGRAQAPFDLTGYWVSLVTDDWRYRMLTPPKGNADYLPVNNEGRRVMGEWDPAKDEAAGEACRGYGAGGVMRLPGRLRISWENDNLLKTGARRGDADAPLPVRTGAGRPRVSRRGRARPPRAGCSRGGAAAVRRRPVSSW